MTTKRPRDGSGASGLRWLSVTLTALAVAACGGGDGGGGGGGNQPTVTLSASPTTVTLGQGTTLTWSSNPGTSCTAAGNWSGAKGGSGSEAVTPTSAGSITFTISCTGGDYSGTGTASVTVTVNAATAFTKTILVADTAGVGAQTVDTNLVNPWGVAFGPTSPVWVANARSDTSTLYDGNGKAQPSANPIIARLPAPAAGVAFEPTGIVFNGTTDFVITSGANSAPARFIFAGEGGAIAGWAGGVDVANAIRTYVDTTGAVYTGLALANDGTGNFLYAANFAGGRVDVFDATFTKQTTTDTRFAFADSTLPAGYAPFGIQALPTGTAGAMQIYVSYARRDAGEEVTGAGLGVVNVFDTNGTFVRRLVADGGALNAPWGMALAPADLGTFSGKLLVGNFGDGKINAFDPATGAAAGGVNTADGQPFAVPGLWGIAFGNDRNNQPHTAIFYAAGTNSEVNGEYGRIDMGSTPPVLNAPPEVTVSAPAAGNVAGTVTVTADVTSSLNVAQVEFLAGATSLGIDNSAPYSVTWDTTQIADGPIALTAKATDANGVTGTSAAVNVTVANTAPPVATFSQLQAQVFTPICTACHVGAAAPQGLRLDAGSSYNLLVGVPSNEVPSLMRVKPGDSANSYLIHKLEGRASVGARMPLGGPFLDQATIDMIKAWIDAGAPNN